jgi:ATP-dependent Clp protease adaptor protein ClpS
MCTRQYPGGMDRANTGSVEPSPLRCVASEGGTSHSPWLASGPAAAPMVEETTELVGEEDKPWVCVVWDDPVNLMSYVTFVLQRTFGYDRGKARTLMLAVHNDGKAAVASGSRDEMENAVRKLQEAGLWATLQKGE